MPKLIFYQGGSLQVVSRLAIDRVKSSGYLGDLLDKLRASDPQNTNYEAIFESVWYGPSDYSNFRTSRLIVNTLEKQLAWPGEDYRLLRVSIFAPQAKIIPRFATILKELEFSNFPSHELLSPFVVLGADWESANRGDNPGT